MLFYCVSAAPEGGETVFVSGRALVEHLGSHNPSLLKQLTTINVRFQKASDFKDRPIISLGEDGSVDLNYNYFCADPNQDERALALNQRFHHYIQELPEEIVLPVALQPGEGVTWRDDLVLHGRNSFTATTTGDRWLWKTGIVLPSQRLDRATP